jgi:hypothetical protein
MRRLSPLFAKSNLILWIVDLRLRKLKTVPDARLILQVAFGLGFPIRLALPLVDSWTKLPRGLKDNGKLTQSYPLQLRFLMLGCCRLLSVFRDFRQNLAPLFLDLRFWLRTTAAFKTA